MNEFDIENGFITPKEARELLHISDKTLRIWAEEGKIGSIRTPSNIRRYNSKDIKRILNGGITPPEKQKICYCRVSSPKQMDDLKRQEDFFRQKYPSYNVVTDIGSGINWKRKGLKTILEQSMQGNISEIVVAHRDRLCRFAFDLLEYIFSANGVKLLVLNETKGESSSKDLADDIMSIVHIYSCREMGRRRYKSKENKTIPECRPEDNIKKLDGGESLKASL
jgi:putative resolvase